MRGIYNHPSRIAFCVSLFDCYPRGAFIIPPIPFTRPERKPDMSDFRQDFLKFALEQNVLKFGEFTTKAGRQSPYFFNAGLFNDASTLALAKFYAQAIIESKNRI